MASEEYRFCNVGMAYNKDWVWPLQFDESNIAAMYPVPAEKPVTASAASPYRFKPQDIDPTYEQQWLF